MDLVGSAVLPKFYLENLSLQGVELLSGAKGRRVVVSGMPRVMVERFVREFLGVSEVLGWELRVVEVMGVRRFSGLAVAADDGLDLRLNRLRELFGDVKADVGLVGSCNTHDHLFIPFCKVC